MSRKTTTIEVEGQKLLYDHSYKDQGVIVLSTSIAKIWEVIGEAQDIEERFIWFEILAQAQ